MKTRKTAILTTTINVPTLLRQYYLNALQYKHKDVSFIVVADKKTPSQAKEFCARLAQEFPYPMIYLDIEEQEAMSSKYSEFAKHMPYNTHARRSFGLLYAYEKGFDIVITIDDDNFVTNHDFVGHHNAAGNQASLNLVDSSTGWFNVCEFLIEDRNLPFYHRGYPWSQRAGQRGFVTQEKTSAYIAVNAGLWLDDPDVDAISRLFWPLRVVGMQEQAAPRFGLQPGTWCPFNTQNTAIAREAIPAYYLSPSNGRFSDIWASYVVCRIAQHLGHVIAYGYPLVRQARNPHNYWRDLEEEKVGAQATDIFVTLLRQTSLTSASYHQCLKELVEGLRAQKQEIKRLPEAQSATVFDFIAGLEIWHGCFARQKNRTNVLESSRLQAAAGR